MKKKWFFILCVLAIVQGQNIMLLISTMDVRFFITSTAIAIAIGLHCSSYKE